MTRLGIAHITQRKLPKGRIPHTPYRIPDLSAQLHTSDHVIAEYDGSDILRKFIYGPGIDEPILMIDVTDSNAICYHHFAAIRSK